MGKGILVFAEVRDGKVKNVAYELLTVGRKIAAEKSEELAAVLIGKGVAGLAGSLAEYGADKIYVAEDDKLEKYTTDGYAKVLGRPDQRKRSFHRSLWLHCSGSRPGR